MRIGLVGLGNAGTMIHLPALAGMPEAPVVGVTDLDPARRETAAARFRVPVFPDFATMLEQAKPEVVIIGTPPATHRDYCLKSLQAGAHVLCEKPFVSSVEEAEVVIAAAQKAGRQVALNHEFREMPIFRALRDQVGTPEVGDLVLAQVWQLMDLPPWKEPGWRGQMLQRTLYEAGVHLVDYLMALFGEKPVSVSCTTSSCGVREGETDAVALVTLEFSRRRLASIVQNRLCRGETQYFEVRAEGTEASLRASFGGRARITAGLHRSTKPHVRFDYGVSGIAWRERGNARTLLARNPKEPAVVAFRYLMGKTLAAFQGRGRAPATAEDGKEVLEVIAACYHSAATGQRVVLNQAASEQVRTMVLG